MEAHFKLSENEHVITSFNDHWITYLRPLFLYIIALILAALFYLLATSTFAGSPSVSFFFLILMTGDIFLATHSLFIFFIRHEISMWIITNKRIIDFRFTPYLQHDVEHVQIQDISEINKNKHGLIQIIFNYGVVKIYSMGKKETIYHYVPKPSLFVNLIETLRNMKEFLPEDVEELRKLY